MKILIEKYGANVKNRFEIGRANVKFRLKMHGANVKKEFVMEMPEIEFKRKIYDKMLEWKAKRAP